MLPICRTKSHGRRRAPSDRSRWFRPRLVSLEDRTLLNADYTNLAPGLSSIFDGVQNAVNDHLWSPPGHQTNNVVDYQYALPLVGENLAPSVQFLHTIGQALAAVKVPTNADPVAVVAPALVSAIDGVVTTGTVNVVVTNQQTYKQDAHDDFEIKIDTASPNLGSVPFSLGLPGLDNGKDKLTQFVASVEKQLTDTVNLTYDLHLFFTVNTQATVRLDTAPNAANQDPVLDVTTFSVNLAPTKLAQQALGNYTVTVTAQGSFNGPGTAFTINSGQYAYQNNNQPIDVTSASSVAFQAGAVPSFELDVSLAATNFPSLDFTLSVTNWTLYVGANPFDYANKDAVGNQPTLAFSLSVLPKSIQDFLNNTVLPNLQSELEPLVPIVKSVQNVLDNPLPVIGGITHLTLKDILTQQFLGFSVANVLGYDPSTIDKIDNWMKEFDQFFNWTAPTPPNLTPISYTITLPSTFDPRDPTAILQSFLDNVADANQLAQQAANVQSNVTNLINFLLTPLPQLGIPLPQVDLPLLTDPLTILKALAGENVVLIQLNWQDFQVVPKLFDVTSPTFPIAWPFGVKLDIGFDGLFAGLSVGYDTYGFTDAWAKDSTNSGKLQGQNGLEGVFVADAHLYLDAHIGLMAVVDIPLVQPTGGGTIQLTFGLGANAKGDNPQDQGLAFGTADDGDPNLQKIQDPDSDGDKDVDVDPYHTAYDTTAQGQSAKVLQAGDVNWDVVNGGPLCAFLIEGVVQLDFSVGVTVGFGPLSHTFTVDLGSFTVADFNFDTCANNPNVHLADTDPSGVSTLITLYNFFNPSTPLPTLAQVEKQFELEDSSFNAGNLADQNVVLLDLGAFRFRWSDYQKANPDPTEADFHVLPDADGSGLVVQGFSEQQDVRLNTAANAGGVNNASTTILVFGDPNYGNPHALDPITLSIDPSVHANVYFLGGAGVNTVKDQGDGDTFLKGGPATNQTLPPVDPNNPQALLPQNTLTGGDRINWLVGGDLAALNPPQAEGASWNVLNGGMAQNSQNVLLGGTAGATLYAGPNNGDQLTAGSPPAGSFSSYVLHAGAGSDRLVGGGMNATTEFDWTEGDGSVDITGGANSAFSPQFPGNAGNTVEITASTPDELWDISTAAQQNPPDPSAIFLAVPNSTATIRAHGVQVLNLDDAPTSNGTSIKYQVDDLSQTSIGLVSVNRHEQTSADAYQDQVVINGPASADTVTVDSPYNPVPNSGPYTLVSITTKSGSVIGLSPVTYYVAAAIPKPQDTLHVNTFAGNDTVLIDATQANLDGTSTGGHVFVSTGGGDDTITVGSPNTGLNYFFGPLDVDAGSGHNKIVFDESESLVNDTVTLTATQVIRATQTAPVTQQNSDVPNQTQIGYPFIINYKVSGGGDWTPQDGSPGVTFQTSTGATTLYVPETGVAAPTEIDCNGGPKPDSMVVGYDGQGQTFFPRTVSQSTLSHLQSRLTVHGSLLAQILPYSLLELDDEAAPANTTYNLGLASPSVGGVQRTGVSPVLYQATGLTVHTGNSGSRVFVAGVPQFATATIQTGCGANQVAVGGLSSSTIHRLDSLFGLLTIKGGSSGVTNLLIDDSGNGFGQSYQLSATQLYRFAKLNPVQPAVTIDYSGLHTLGFRASDNTGLGVGPNSIDVVGTAAKVPVGITAGDGDASLQVNGLDNIRASLSFAWAAGKKYLAVNDNAASAGAVYQVSNGAATTTVQRSGAATVTLNGFLTDWLLFLGGHANTVRLEAVAKGTSADVVSGLGQDTVFVADQPKSLDAIAGPLSIFGNTITQVTLDDQNAAARRKYLLAASALQLVQNPSPPPIDFFGLADLTLNGGPAATALVQATTQGTTTQLNLGTGTNQVTVGAPGTWLAAIAGPVAVTGQSGKDQLILNDQGGAAIFYTINPSSINSSQSVAVAFAKLAGVTLFGAAGMEMYTVQGVPTVPLTINGQAVANVLEGPAQDNTWKITGPDSGTLDQAITFHAIQNLVGNTGKDDFLFQSAGHLTGHLDGGSGADTLDFSGLAQAVAVALTQRGSIDGVQGTASVIGNGFDNIDVVTGNAGSTLNGAGFSGNFDTNLQLAGFNPFSWQVPGNFSGNLQAPGETLQALTVGMGLVGALSGSVVANSISSLTIAQVFSGQIVVAKSFGSISVPVTAPTAHVWIERAGAFTVANGALVGTQSSNRASVNGLTLTDVTVQASLAQALLLNQQVSLVARYDTAANTMYLATLQNTASGVIASIVLDQNGKLTTLASAKAASASGTLTFKVTGTSLQLLLNNTLVVGTTDKTLAGGDVGIQLDAGVALTGFVAS